MQTKMLTIHPSGSKPTCDEDADATANACDSWNLEETLAVEVGEKPKVVAPAGFTYTVEPTYFENCERKVIPGTSYTFTPDAANSDKPTAEVPKADVFAQTVKGRKVTMKYTRTPAGGAEETCYGKKVMMTKEPATPYETGDPTNINLKAELKTANGQPIADNEI